MTELKATPGPYFVTGNMTLYVEARIGGGMIQEVAACGPTDADGGYGEQQRANANLFAASRDLYEALEQLDEAYCRAGYDLTKEERIEDRKRLISARNALAKARGE